VADTEIETKGVKTKLRDFIVNNFLFGTDELHFDDDDSFLEKGIIDSTGILELIEYLEETYAMTIEDDELIPENLDSLNRVEVFVGRKMSDGKD